MGEAATIAVVVVSLAIAVAAFLAALNMRQ